MSQERVSLASGVSLSSIVGAGSPAYVGIDLLQEQTRVKALRSGFVFNLMLVGRSGLGKSTLVNTLFKSEVAPRTPGTESPIPSTTQVQSSTRELNENGVKLRVTITDTPGFGDNINNENCWEPLVEYIKDQYSKYLEEETKIERLQTIPDNRVHCCLYFIQPSGHELSCLDVEVLKKLEAIVNVIPVIAKSDTLTLEERALFKERIRTTLEYHRIRFYPQQGFEDQEDSAINTRIRDHVPFAIVGSSVWHEVQGKKILGRKTSCGLVEVENHNHSDFPLLRDLLIRTHMRDLVERTALHHYENIRRDKLSQKKDILDE